MSFLKVPQYLADKTEWLRKIANAINLIMDGKTNNTGTVTLTASSTTTTITFASGRLGAGTVILLTPTTANAAGAVSGLYVSGRDVASNQLTLTHASTAAVDKTFDYVLVG